MTQAQFKKLVYYIIDSTPNVYLSGRGPRFLRGERGIAVYFRQDCTIRIVTIDYGEVEIKAKDWSKYKSMIGNAPERGMDMDAMYGR